MKGLLKLVLVGLVLVGLYFALGGELESGRGGVCPPGMEEHRVSRSYHGLRFSTDCGSESFAGGAFSVDMSGQIGVYRIGTQDADWAIPGVRFQVPTDGGWVHVYWTGARRWVCVAWEPGGPGSEK